MLTSAHIQVLISGVPYFFNFMLTHAALRAHVSICDFGGNTEQVQQQLAYDNEAKAAGITLIAGFLILLIHLCIYAHLTERHIQ